MDDGEALGGAGHCDVEFFGVGEEQAGSFGRVELEGGLAFEEGVGPDEENKGGLDPGAGVDGGDTNGVAGGGVFGIDDAIPEYRTERSEEVFLACPGGVDDEDIGSLFVIADDKAELLDENACGVAGAVGMEEGGGRSGGEVGEHGIVGKVDLFILLGETAEIEPAGEFEYPAGVAVGLPESLGTSPDLGPEDLEPGLTAAEKSLSGVGGEKEPSPFGIENPADTFEPDRGEELGLVDVDPVVGGWADGSIPVVFQKEPRDRCPVLEVGGGKIISIAEVEFVDPSALGRLEGADTTGAIDLEIPVEGGAGDGIFGNPVEFPGNEIDRELAIEVPFLKRPRDEFAGLGSGDDLVFQILPDPTVKGSPFD